MEQNFDLGCGKLPGALPFESRQDHLISQLLFGSQADPKPHPIIAIFLSVEGIA